MLSSAQPSKRFCYDSLGFGVASSAQHVRCISGAWKLTDGSWWLILLASFGRCGRADGLEKFRHSCPKPIALVSLCPVHKHTYSVSQQSLSVATERKGVLRRDNSYGDVTIVRVDYILLMTTFTPQNTIVGNRSP